MVHAACWSHARRGFVDAIKVNKLDVASIGIVELMDKLFAIDAGAREEKMDHAARHALRQKEGPPLLEKIHAQILELSKNVLPKSAAGEACGYTIKLWKKLSCFLEHPELELSNNLAENSMRGIALGEKTGPISAAGRPDRVSPRSSPCSKAVAGSKSRFVNT
jgi:transposase